MRSPERPSKHEAFLALLQEGWTSLHLDARRPGVIVPPHLRGEPHLVLQYGHDLPIPIPDLEVDEHGVRATLSFSKNPQRTFVPWSSVYVVTCNDGRGVLYHEDVPEDVSIIATHPHGDRLPDDTVTVGAGRDIGDGGDLADLVTGEDDGDEAFETPAQERLVGANVPTGRITGRLLRLVPEEGAGAGVGAAAAALDRPVAGRRRRRPQLRLVK